MKLTLAVFLFIPWVAWAQTAAPPAHMEWVSSFTHTTPALKEPILDMGGCPLGTTDENGKSNSLVTCTSTVFVPDAPCKDWFPSYSQSPTGGKLWTPPCLAKLTLSQLPVRVDAVCANALGWGPVSRWWVGINIAQEGL